MKRLIFLGACFTVVLGSVASLLQSVEVAASSEPNSVSVAIPPALRSIKEIRVEQERQRDVITDLSKRLYESQTETDSKFAEILHENSAQLALLASKFEQIEKSQLEILEFINKNNMNSVNKAGLGFTGQKSGNTENLATFSLGENTQHSAVIEGETFERDPAPLAINITKDKIEKDKNNENTMINNFTVADGISAYNAGDYTRAHRIWKKLAAQGNPQAQYFLGSILFEGKGVPKNLEEAREWFEIAHRNGFTRADLMIRRVDESLSKTSY